MLFGWRARVWLLLGLQKIVVAKSLARERERKREREGGGNY